jgi:hypothetical protein
MSVKKGQACGSKRGYEKNQPQHLATLRHLQKLRSGYLEKNEFGKYKVKCKAQIRSYAWLGRRLMPKIGSTYEFKVLFLLLMLITGLALAVFTFKGFLQYRRKSSITELSI